MPSTIISIDIGEEVNRELDRLARETGRDKRDIARNAISEWPEDVEDARDALEILERNAPASGIDEVRKRLGLER